LIASEDSKARPLMRCLKDYRANSECWRDFGNCYACFGEYRDSLRPLFNCRVPSAACSCNICHRQSLSLHDSALHTVFQQTVNISQFKLTVYTTYDEYAYTVWSNRASLSVLLPPEYPIVRTGLRTTLPVSTLSSIGIVLAQGHCMHNRRRYAALLLM
jgi:hypothetical protein